MPLEGGITSIVGPNGSGKSNITDAVLFAIGEQSPGVLRAGAMSELIFAGSETLPGASAAEVTLVLDNEAGWISLPYKEVSITRRISRGGETEYRINGSRARLADIRAVAGEAGLGRHSILRQGAVDSIVAGGAAACRLALEEAAGLGVYRRRRVAASRRLERADAQLEQSRKLEAGLESRLQHIEEELRKTEVQLEGLEDGAEDLRVEALRADRALLRLEAGHGREGEMKLAVSRLEDELRRVSQTMEGLEGQVGDLEAEGVGRREESDRLQEVLARSREESASAERERARLA